MGPGDIGPEEARAALAQLGTTGAAVRRGDLERVGLLITAGGLVGYSLLVVALRGFVEWPLINIALLLFLSAFALWREVMQRVIRRTNRAIASLWVVSTMVLFTVLQFWVAPRIGWHSPVPDWHFVAISVVAALPLLLGAWLLGRGR